MKGSAEVIILGAEQRDSKGKLYRSVEVTQNGEKTLKLDIPSESNGLYDQVKAAYMKPAKIEFQVQPGFQFGTARVVLLSLK